MKKQITKLTAEQESMFGPWADKWISIGLRTGETDWVTFDKYMPICYSKAGLKYPSRVVRVNSPLVGALAAAISESILRSSSRFGTVRDAVDGAVGDAVDGTVGDAVRDAVGGAVGGAVDGAVDGAVRDAVDGAVGDAVDGAVGDAVRDAVGGAVGGAVDGAVGGAVGDAVRGAVGGAVGGAVRGSVKNIKWHYWLGGQFWVGGWWGSPAFVSFFTDICDLKLDKDISERAEAYRRLSESVNYIWPNSDFVIVCARPTKILLDDSGRLHSETGHAIEYPDGWGISSWHGVVIPDRWITHKEITPQQALTWPNMEQRRAACEIIGWDKLFDILDKKLIDKHENQMIGELYSVNLPDAPNEHFLRFRCATGRMFVQNVDPCKTALEAQHWIWQDDDYQPEVES